MHLRSFLLICLLHQWLFAQNAPELSFLNLTGLDPLTIEDCGWKGSVKQVHSTTYRTMMGKETVGTETITDFDTYGRITHDRMTLRYNGMLMGDFERDYTYNDKGKLIEMVWHAPGNPALDRDVMSFEYNEKNQLKDKVYLSSKTGSSTLEEFTYGPQGHLIQWTSTPSFLQSPTQIKSFTYDANNRITRVTHIINGEMGPDTAYHEYTYAANIAFPVASIYADAINYGKTAIRTAFQYNAYEDLIKSTMRMTEDMTEGMTEVAITNYFYTYDAEGNWTEKRDDSYMKEREVRKFTYYTEVTPHIYRKTIQTTLTPTMNNLSAFMQAAQMHSETPEVMQKQLEKMLITAQNDLDQLKKLGELTGNNARKYAVQYLEYVVSSEGRQLLRNMYLTNENLEMIRTFSGNITGIRNQLIGELNKL